MVLVFYAVFVCFTYAYPPICAMSMEEYNEAWYYYLVYMVLCGSSGSIE